MKTRTIVALGFLVVVGALVAWKLARKDPHVRDEKGATQAQAGIPPLKAAEIDELEIDEPGKPKVHLKKDGEWKLLEPVADRADQKNVEATLQTLEKMKLKDVVAESADSYAKLGIKDDEAVKVVAKKAGAPLATLLVSKTGRQVRVEGKPQVFEVAELSRYLLARDGKMWRDREILRFERDQLDRLEVTWPNGGTIAAKREAPPAPPATAAAADASKPKPPGGPDKWTLLQGAPAVGGALDESIPSAMATTLARLDAADFAEGVTDPGPVRATVTAVLKDGSKKELVIGKEDGQDVLVKRADSPRVWKIRKTSVDAMVKEPPQWRDKTLSKLDVKDVQRIEVVKDAARTVFERVDDKTWRAVEPADLKEVDSGKVTGLAAGFANLKATSVVVSPDPKKTGLAKPTATITVKAKDKSVTLTVGALEEKAYYVKVSGRDEVFSLGEFVISRYLKPASDFKKQPAAAQSGMPPGHPM